MSERGHAPPFPSKQEEAAAPSPSDVKKEQAGLIGPSKWLLLPVLAILGCSQSLLVTASKVEGHYAYISETVPLLAECFKACLAFTFLAKEFGSRETLKRLGAAFKKPTTVLFSIPALLYLINNNLVFVALMYLDPAEYQILANLKIVSTALLMRCMLSRKLNDIQWSAVILLLIGSSMTRLGSCGESQEITAMGLIIMSVVSLFSGLAGVYSEKLLKQNPQHLHVQNLQLYTYGIIANALSLFYRQGDRISSEGFFVGYSPLIFFVVINQACMGFVVSFVMKYADNLIKLMAGAMSMLLAAIISAWLFGTSIQLTTLCSMITVATSVYLYTKK